MNQNAKLCLLRLSAIGDVCHAVALITRIQRHRPDIQITWIIGKIEYQLVKNLPNIRFIVFDKSKGKQAFKDLKSELNNERFDALFAMQVALRANLIARLINAPKKFGFDWHRSKELHWLFTNKRVAPHPHCHVLDGFMDFADAVNIPKLTQVEWDFVTEDKANDWAQEQLSNSHPYIVINPAASKKERNWLPERYAQLADHLNLQGFKVVLTGGPSPNEVELGKAISTSAQHTIINLIGKTSLQQLACVLSKAKLVVAPDTGPAHIAAMMGTKVVGLYAHSNPRRTGPYNNIENAVSVYDEVIQEQKGKPWNELSWGTRAKGKDLMKRILLQAVTQKCDELLHK